MARHWLGRKHPDATDRRGEDSDGAPEGDPVSGEAESERDEKPPEVGEGTEPGDTADPSAPTAPDGRAAALWAAGVTDRLRSAIGRAVAATGPVVAATGPAVKARLPAVWAALQPRIPRLVLAVAAGLLMCASFPSVNWWWAAVVAAALLGWVLMHPATTLVGGLGYSFLFGLAFYVPLLPWISSLVGAVPWLVLAMTCALFPGLFGLLAVVVRRLPGWPIWFASLWVAQEWLKSTFPFGGFPWGLVAFGQAEGPFLPLVQLGGVALLSAAIMLVGFSLTAIELEIAKWWRSGHRVRHHDGGPSGDGLPETAPPAVVLPGLCICLVLLASIVVWPQVRHAGAASGGDPAVTVAAVQGNVPRLGFGFNEQRRAVLDNHVRETLQLAEDVRAGLAPQPQLVIWPEDSSDIDPIANPDAAQQISQAAAAIGAPILVGTILDVPSLDVPSRDVPGSSPQNPRYTNTVIVWNPSSGPADRHDKEIIQPFGEYLPMRWLFKHLSGYADRAGNMVPGTSSDVVHIAGVPVGVATCWEVIFDRAPRKAVLNGAQLLAVPSNNATFNKTMSEQQLAFAKVRAVEHDRYVVVAGTTGISAVIAPDGGELVRTEFFQPAYLDLQVHLKTKLTPATRWAPIVQWAFAVVAGAVVLLAIRQNGWSPRTLRSRLRPSGDADDTGGPPDEAPSDRGDVDRSPVEDGDRNPPGDGGGYTPLHEGGGAPARNSGRHRGAT